MHKRNTPPRDIQAPESQREAKPACIDIPQELNDSGIRKQIARIYGRTADAVLVEIYRRAGRTPPENNFRICWPSQENIAANIGSSRRTVKDKLAAMISDGIIPAWKASRPGQHGQRTHYRALDSDQLAHLTQELEGRPKAKKGKQLPRTIAAPRTATKENHGGATNLAPRTANNLAPRTARKYKESNLDGWMDKNIYTPSIQQLRVDEKALNQKILTSSAVTKYGEVRPTREVKEIINTIPPARLLPITDEYLKDRENNKVSSHGSLTYRLTRPEEYPTPEITEEDVSWSDLLQEFWHFVNDAGRKARLQALLDAIPDDEDYEKILDFLEARVKTIRADNRFSPAESENQVKALDLQAISVLEALDAEIPCKEVPFPKQFISLFLSPPSKVEREHVQEVDAITAPAAKSQRMPPLPPDDWDDIQKYRRYQDILNVDAITPEEHSLQDAARAAVKAMRKKPENDATPQADESPAPQRPEAVDPAAVRELEGMEDCLDSLIKSDSTLPKDQILHRKRMLFERIEAKGLPPTEEHKHKAAALHKQIIKPILSPQPKGKRENESPRPLDTRPARQPANPGRRNWPQQSAQVAPAAAGD